MAAAKKAKKVGWPRLHNAAWPGLVGKGPDSEPPIDLDTMISLTAAAEADGARFDGMDLFLFDPHVSIDAGDDELKRLAGKFAAKNLAVGSLVAPVWPPTGGGSAMGGEEDRRKFVTQVRKACVIGKKLRKLGVRKYGVIRIDTACGPGDWLKDPYGATKNIVKTFREACKVAEGFGEKLAAEGEICWGGLHSWRKSLDLLEKVDCPKTLGFQADMATHAPVPPGLQCAGGCPPARGVRLAGSGAPRRGLQGHDRRAASVDD